jgi:hypothetical protein
VRRAQAAEKLYLPDCHPRVFRRVPLIPMTLNSRSGAVRGRQIVPWLNASFALFDLAIDSSFGVISSRDTLSLRSRIALLREPLSHGARGKRFDFKLGLGVPDRAEISDSISLSAAR